MGNCVVSYFLEGYWPDPILKYHQPRNFHGRHFLIASGFHRQVEFVEDEASEEQR